MSARHTSRAVVPVRPSPTSVTLVGQFGPFVQPVLNTVMVLAQEQTERQRIAASVASDIEAIRAKRDVMLGHLAASSEERRMGVASLGDALRMATASGDAASVRELAQAIVAVVGPNRREGLPAVGDTIISGTAEWGP